MATPINKGNIPTSRWWKTLLFHLRRGRGHLFRYYLNRRRWRLWPAKQHVGVFPEHVDLELSSLCDLKCPMCYTITDRFKREVPHKLMDWDLFTRLVDECVREGVYSIRLSLRGESFLHPKIVDMVRYAKRAGIREVSSLTNNHRLDEAMFRELMDAGLDWLTISFDGIGERYDSIRWPNTFAKSIAKIRNYQAIKQELGSVKPVIKVQSVWPAVADDPQAYYDAFEGLVDEIAVNPIIDYTHIQDRDAVLYEDDFTCPSLWQRLVVFSDGRVPLCQNDEFGSHIIGDARESTLRQIWHGEEMTRQRRIQTEGRGVECNGVCADCYLPRRTEPFTVQLRDRSLHLYDYAVRDGAEHDKLVENLGKRLKPVAGEPSRRDAAPTS